MRQFIIGMILGLLIPYIGCHAQAQKPDAQPLGIRARDAAFESFDHCFLYEYRPGPQRAMLGDLDVSQLWHQTVCGYKFQKAYRDIQHNERN